MTEVALTCANHPTRETSLRCKRCNKPICASCAVLTPVGYRCRECVREQQAIFDTAGGGGLAVGAGGGAGYLLVQSAPWLLVALSGQPAVVPGLAFSLLWPLGYGALLISALYSRLRGIRLSRET